MNISKLVKTNHIKCFGDSMKPLFYNEDIVFFKKTNYQKIKINDIVVVKNKKSFFIHRAIFKKASYLITKGDNNLKSDGKINPDNIVGTVYQVNRNNKSYNLPDIYLLQSTLYFQEIIKIVKKFETNNINYVFIKGLPLYLFIEKSHPSRLYYDCDVLINKKDYLITEKVLVSAGFKKVRTTLPGYNKKIKNKEIECAFLKHINGFPVVFDLHLEPVFMMTQLGKLDNLYPQKLIDEMADEFIKTKRKIILNENCLNVLNEDNLIVYLALHFFHHNFQGTHRLNFLNFVINRVKEKKEIWNKILTTIIKYKLENFVYPTFRFLKKYYNSSLDNNFIRKIKPSNQLVFLYVNHLLNNSHFFDNEPRLVSGLNRFVNLFVLSPLPLYKKVLVFFNYQVIYSIFWYFQRKLFSFSLKS